MDFRSLEVFVWVATLGSFRRAAARLNTTQPAVSQRIAQLEAELGTRLLERSRRSVALTERGRLVLGEAERILRLASGLRAAIGDPVAVRGTLRLGVAETIVHTWLSIFVERVSAAYPNLALEIEVDVTPRLREQLLRRELDLAFLLGPVAEPAIRNRALCRFPLAFLASPDHPVARDTTRLAEIAGHALVTFSRRTQPYLALVDLCREAGFAPRIHASASLATVLRMALDGIGIAVIPPVIAEAELASGRLRTVPVATHLPELAFTASWPDAPDGTMAEALAGIAAAVAGGGAAPRAAGSELAPDAGATSLAS